MPGFFNKNNLPQDPDTEEKIRVITQASDGIDPPEPKLDPGVDIMRHTLSTSLCKPKS